jgi:hypothetical protein
MKVIQLIFIIYKILIIFLIFLNFPYFDKILCFFNVLVFLLGAYSSLTYRLLIIVYSMTIYLIFILQTIFK